MRCEDHPPMNPRIESPWPGTDQRAGLPRATGTLLFDTAIGRCALAYSEHGLTAVRLPGPSDAQTLSALADARGAPPDPSAPAWVTQAIDAMQQHLAGQAHDLRDVPLDIQHRSPRDDISEFEQRVYAATRALDPGCTCSYGELALAIGEPAAMRAVGRALGRNPWPLVVPCHRVLAAGGRLGGFSAPGGSDTKRRLLVLEAAMRRREDELF